MLMNRGCIFRYNFSGSFLSTNYLLLPLIQIWNHRKAGAVKLAEDVSGWLKPDQIIEVSETVKDCVKEAELIVTVTFSHEPVMKARDDLKKTDCHIMAVGAPRQRFVPSI